MENVPIIKPKVLYQRRAVVFIDLLGFSYSCTEPYWSRGGIVKAASDYEVLVSMAYGSRSSMVDGPTWEASLSLSDSVFLSTPEPDVAIVCASIVFHAIYTYSHIRGLQAMIRGGIGYGDVVYDVAIDDVESSNLPQPRIGNIYGPAVVEAVTLEKSGPGPRLFCSKSILPALQGSMALNLLVEADDADCYEVLWGALSRGNVSIVRKVFSAAVDAYEQASDLPTRARRHYVQGICVAIRCLSHYFKTPRHRVNASFETDLRKRIMPGLKRVTHVQDRGTIDRIIRRELGDQARVRKEYASGIQGP